MTTLRPDQRRDLAHVIRDAGQASMDEALDIRAAVEEFYAALPASPEPAPVNSELREGIKAALNRASAENGSDTPDHVLVDFLLDCLTACLTAFDTATLARSAWYGHHQQVEATTEGATP